MEKQIFKKTVQKGQKYKIDTQELVLLQQGKLTFHHSSSYKRCLEIIADTLDKELSNNKISFIKYEIKLSLEEKSVYIIYDFEIKLTDAEKKKILDDIDENNKKTKKIFSDLEKGMNDVFGKDSIFDKFFGRNDLFSGK